MKKHLQIIVLSVAGFFSATDNSFSQNYSISPNDSVEISGVFEDLQTLIVNQVNTSNDTIQLQWEKISEVVPSAWDASVCDNSICYTTLINSGSMAPVFPGDYGFLLLHITPHINFGTAVVRYAVWDVNYPASRDTLTFILKVDSTSAIDEAEENSAFGIFPNPSVNSFNITSNSETEFYFSISDQSGKEVTSGFSKTNSIAVSTNDFPKGIYNATILVKTKKSISKNFIVQH